MSIYWGDISQIKAELTVLRVAAETAKYDYYHLISGQDMPLHSQDDIHKYFDSVAIGSNFIGFSQGKLNDENLRDRICQYVLFTKYYKKTSGLLGWSLCRIRNLYLKLQKKLNHKKRMPALEYRKGCNWASMTDEFVRYILSLENKILHTFKGTLCCDEIYKQTLIWNSPFRRTIFDTIDEFHGALREIDWRRGRPYVFTSDDYQMLTSSTKMFARKFDSKINREIIDLLSEHIMNK